jgi:hypothetical protein
MQISSVAWNNLTLADSNKLKKIKMNLENLSYNRFISPNSFCNYEAVLNYLHSKTLYCRRKKILMPDNIFKNKIDYFIMDAVGLRVPAKQIRDFSTFSVSNVSRISPSAGCVTAANVICRSVDVFNKHNIFLEDTFSLD